MNRSPVLIQFGAGKIGRSLVGALFSRGGYHVTFVDIDEELVAALNEKKTYRVVVKQNDAADRLIQVDKVSALSGTDTEAVVAAVADADLVATSAGQQGLIAIMPLLAQALVLREARHGTRPLDIIIAENLRDASGFFTRQLAALLPQDYPLQQRVGLVETSIGKMVPLMRPEDLAEDPLWVFAERYNKLIVDGDVFKSGVPDVPGVEAKTDMPAWVDRKLFIHNLGHAAAAYLGYAEDPEMVYVYQAVAHPKVAPAIAASMHQAAAALRLAYPHVFTEAELLAHIEDLLSRFANRALGDTLHRVGRDLYRKLSRNDRITGALRLAAKHHCPADAVCAVARAAVHFKAPDEHGSLFAEDVRFFETDAPKGLRHILENVCGLDEKDPVDKKTMDWVLGVS